MLLVFPGSLSHLLDLFHVFGPDIFDLALKTRELVSLRQLQCNKLTLG